ncbi:allergen Tha p 1-like [Aricia agestis]|uniref:allergen Tha p 1-like n=1 Tax=Aricia agestis TaxID=91739 RepID=UPI001C2025CE|nr:allergen Tha p 1-like [Aricia agestis]
MKFVILCLLGIIPLAWSYADVSDKVHFEDIIKKPDVLRAELYCYLDRGPCDEVAAQHKIHITEAVDTACAKCTPTHKHNVKVFIQGVSHLFPELYHEFRDRYDPDGKHYDVLIDEVQKF